MITEGQAREPPSVSFATAREAIVRAIGIALLGDAEAVKEDPAYRDQAGEIADEVLASLGGSSAYRKDPAPAFGQGCGGNPVHDRTVDGVRPDPRPDDPSPPSDPFHSLSELLAENPTPPAELWAVCFVADLLLFGRYGPPFADASAFTKRLREKFDGMAFGEYEIDKLPRWKPHIYIDPDEPKEGE